MSTCPLREARVIAVLPMKYGTYILVSLIRIDSCDYVKTSLFALAVPYMVLIHVLESHKNGRGLPLTLSLLGQYPEHLGSF